MSRGYCAVGLYHPKNHLNVGSVLRAAHAFDVIYVAMEGRRYKHAITDPAHASRHMPLMQYDSIFDGVPYNCVPVAIEMVQDAQDLRDYVHPERAYYIFGPEDGSLGDAVLSKCRDKVRIQTNGCLNLAAAVNVVLYDRTTKGSYRRA